jgi:hypothetical protein
MIQTQDWFALNSRNHNCFVAKLQIVAATPYILLDNDLDTYLDIHRGADRVLGIVSAIG